MIEEAKMYYKNKLCINNTNFTKVTMSVTRCNLSFAEL